MFFLNPPATSVDDDAILMPPRGGTLVRSSHVFELRTAVAALRTLAGLPPPIWGTTAVSGPVRSNYLLEISALLNETRAALGFSSATITTVPVTGGLIRGATMRDLREGVK